MRRFSITDKLIIASLTISIITIIIVATFSFFRTKNAILERTFNQLTSVKAIKTNLLEKFFTNSVKEVKLASSSSDIRAILKQINNNDSLKDIASLNGSTGYFNTPFIKEISEKYFSKIIIIGPNKTIYYIKSEDYPSNQLDTNYDILFDYMIKERDVVINDFTKEKSIANNVIRLSSRVLDISGNVLGIIVFEIPSSAIDDIMLESSSANGLGVSGESYLVGTDYLMRSSSRFIKNSILKIRVKTEASESALKGFTGTKIIHDYRGIKVLSSYGRISIPGLNWVILAEIDYKEATIPIYRIRNEIILISVFIFLIVLVLVIILSKFITVPIEKLNRAVQEISSGNLNFNVNPKSNDEIGELTESFNNMIGKLKYQSGKIKEEQAKSLSSLIDGQEIERQRLSRELHDSLGQLLIGLKLKYESCINHLQPTDRCDTGFDSLEVLFDKTIEETRRISNNLMPAALSEFGLTTAVRNICNEISETTKINIQFRTTGKQRINSKRVNIYVFRIVQEALTNIVKHAEATNASVEFVFVKSSLQIMIADNGKGFNSESTKTHKGHGIINIDDRVSLLKGKFTLISKLSKGTQINIIIPLNEDEYG